ncbi:hypothetical protein HQ520_09975 [bacterium]|nr:hypothetical protein [bacterium]
MTVEPVETERDDLALRVFIRDIYERRYRLGVICVIVGVLVALYALTLENQYQATAAVIIREPELPITGEAAPLTTEMLQALLDSTEVKSTVFEKLRQENALDSETSFRGFQKMLSTSVERRRGPNPELLPMIRLTAQSKTPERSARIANVWADTVTSKTREMYASGVEDVSAFIGAISSKAETDLAKSEDAYTSILLTANLEVNKATLAQDRSNYGKLYSEYLVLTGDAEEKGNLLEDIRKRLEEREIDGMWVGEIGNDELSSRTDLTTSVLERPVVLVSIALRRNEEELAKFERESQIQYLQMLLRTREQQLEQIAKEIIDKQNQLVRSETKVAKLQIYLANIPQKIELFKAVSNDVLGEMAVQGDARVSDPDKLPRIRDEVSNPVYEAVKQEEVMLASEVEGLKSQVEYYQERQEYLRQEVSDLASSISRLESRKENLQSIIQKDKKMLVFFEEEYNESRQMRETLAKELNETRARMAARQTELGRLEKEMDGLEERILLAEDRLNAHKREVENRMRVRESLAAKAEEVTLLGITARQASRSGQTILYGAKPNPQKVAPTRTKMVLGAMALCFVFLCVWVVLKRLIRETEPGRSPASV